MGLRDKRAREWWYSLVYCMMTRRIGGVRAWVIRCRLMLGDDGRCPQRHPCMKVSTWTEIDGENSSFGGATSGEVAMECLRPSKRTVCLGGSGGTMRRAVLIGAAEPTTLAKAR